jgi:uncharacterized protein (DUF58 family)
MKTRERIYIVPTWAGLIFAFTLLAIFAAGYFAHGFGGPVQVLVMSLVVAGIVALILTNDNMRGVEVLDTRIDPTAAGEPACLRLTIKNTSDTERLGLLVRYRDGWKLKSARPVPVLPGGESRSVELSIPTTKRGIFPVPAIWVSSRLPVGLCFAWKVFQGLGSYHVYPAGKTWRPLPQSAGHLEGDGKAGHEDVDGHRTYSPGDPLSRVDWRVFARTGRVVVRTFDGAGSHRTILGWQDTDFLFDPEDRLEQMSFWITECVRGRQPWQVRMGTATFSERNLRGCRMALASFPGER